MAARLCGRFSAKLLWELNRRKLGEQLSPWEVRCGHLA